MTILESLIAISLVTAPPPHVDDPFFNEDKVKHFAASFVVSSLAISAARAAGLEHREGIIAGAGFTLAAGVGKEISDARGGQYFSVRDLLWNIAGTGAGVVLLDRTR